MLLLKSIWLYLIEMLQSEIADELLKKLHAPRDPVITASLLFSPVIIIHYCVIQCGWLALSGSFLKTSSWHWGSEGILLQFLSSSTDSQIRPQLALVSWKFKDIPSVYFLRLRKDKLFHVIHLKQSSTAASVWGKLKKKRAHYKKSYSDWGKIKYVKLYVVLAYSFFYIFGFIKCNPAAGLQRCTSVEFIFNKSNLIIVNNVDFGSPNPC